MPDEERKKHPDGSLMFSPDDILKLRDVLTPTGLFSFKPAQRAQFSDEDVAHIVRKNDNKDLDSKHVSMHGGGAHTVAANKMGPLTQQAIIEHPSLEVVRSFLANNKENKLTDEQFNGIMERTEPTVNGITATPADHLRAHTIHHAALGAFSAGTPLPKDTEGDAFLDNWWKENRLKDITNEAISRYPHATSEQLDASMERLKRNHPQDQQHDDHYENIISGYLGHPNIHKEQIKKIADQNPYLVMNTIRDVEAHGEDKEGHATQDPEVINHVYNKIVDDQAKRPSDQGSWNAIARIHDHNGPFKKVSPENIHRTWKTVKAKVDAGTSSPLGVAELARHPNASPQTLHDIWNWTQTQPDEATKKGLMPSKELSSTHDPKHRLGLHLIENPSLPPEVLSDIIAKTDTFNPAHAPSATAVHHKQMLDKAITGGYFESPRYRGTNEDVIEGVKEHAKDPATLKYLFDNEKAAGNFSSTPDNQVSRDFYDNYLKNPNTPPEVLSELHSFVPKDEIMDHANFPAKRLEELADGGSTHAKSKLVDIDPDKHLYGEEGAYKMRHTSLEPGSGGLDGIHGKDYGSTEIKPGLSKLRVFRDKILEKDPAKGELSPKDLGQGPFGGNWKPVQEKNGNISAKKLQELIDSHPSTKYNFGHEEWDGAQRHSDHPQRVFKLNVTTDHINQMKAAGVYPTFKKLSEYSNESGHPSDSGHTIGWVRYEHHQNNPKVPGGHLKPVEDPAQLHERQKSKDDHSTVYDKPEAIHVDEMQTDMGPNTISKLKERPERAHAMGVNTDHLDTINSIVFGKHHPSEILMEAFKQHQRDKGHHDVPIHMLDAKTKAPISGMREKELPAHMQFSYNQMPKKMGFSPGKYGETVQQDNPEVKGGIWSDKIRKFEEELISKAIDDIKPGKETSSLPADKQAKLPNWAAGKAGVHDYGHLLTPQHKRAGYQLLVHHVPDHKITTRLFHKGQEVGQAEAIVNPYTSSKLRISTVAIGGKAESKHRGKGLGTAMYEALLAHAKHKAGVDTIHGTSHSSMAHAVHEKISKKHGLAYKALPNYMEGTAQHWENEDDWNNAPSGPNDDKWGGYEYMLKSDHPLAPKKPMFRAAGFKNHETGQIFETGPFHDIEALPPEHQDLVEKLEHGFVTHEGTFLNRQQAAKYAQMPKKFQEGTQTHSREWLDSSDKEAFGAQGKVGADIHTTISKSEYLEFTKNEDGVVSMLEQDDPLERILALKSAMVMPHHILMAINDQDPQVRNYAATHPLINGPLLTECLRQCKAPDTFKILLGHESASDEHMNYALETNWGGNGGFEDEDSELG